MTSSTLDLIVHDTCIDLPKTVEDRDSGISHTELVVHDDLYILTHRITEPRLDLPVSPELHLCKFISIQDFD